MSSMELFAHSSQYQTKCVSGLCFSKSPKPDAQKEKGKKPRVWDLGNSNAKVLDYSDSTTNGNSEACPVEEFDPDVVRSQVTVSASVHCSRVSWASRTQLGLHSWLRARKGDRGAWPSVCKAAV